MHAVPYEYSRFELQPVLLQMRRTIKFDGSWPQGVFESAQPHTGPFLYVRSTSLRACLRQQGSVIFQRLTAQLKLCPSERFPGKLVFRQPLKRCPDTVKNLCANSFRILLIVCLFFPLFAWPQQPDPQEGTTVGN